MTHFHDVISDLRRPTRELNDTIPTPGPVSPRSTSTHSRREHS